jgi:hypothetical protein
MSNPLALVPGLLGLTPWAMLPVIACLAVSLSALVVISAHLVSGPGDLHTTTETAAERYARRDVRVDER